MGRAWVSNLLGLLGAAAGGLVGYLAFRWVLTQGFYGLVLPGGLLGVGCALLSGHRSTARGIACGLAALVLGLFAEWRAFPFIQDEGVWFFVTHLHWLKPVTWLMIVAGALLAAWIGRDHYGLFRARLRPPTRDEFRSK